MKRRRKPNSDSLELLLDTICNTFGGILFIALLVVILLQMTQPPAPAASPVTAAGNVEELALTRDQLREQLDGQRETVLSLSPADMEDLLQQQAKREQTRDQLSRELEAGRRARERGQTALAAAELDAVQTATAVEQLIAENARIETQVAKEKADRRSEIRLSAVRPARGRAPVIMILQYNRLYFWHRFDRFGSREGLNTDDMLVLGELLGRVETTPNPAAGIPVTEGNAFADALRQKLRPFPPRDYYVSVIVRPDSFGNFTHVKNLLVQAGYEFKLTPAEDDDEYVDRGGSGAMVQ